MIYYFCYYAVILSFICIPVIWPSFDLILTNSVFISLLTTKTKSLLRSHWEVI